MARSFAMSTTPEKKLVLITGASSGIGRATAERYGQAGTHVLLLARNAERLNAVAASIRKAGGTATAFPIDLADSDATMELSARIKRDIGVPDILINNAGAGRSLPLAATTLEEADTMMKVPYFAAFITTRAFLPEMVARGSGVVGFITSPASYLAWPNASAYTAVRRALAGFAETLQTELVGKGVTVTFVVLGLVDSPYWENNPGSREKLPPGNPLLMPVLTSEQAAKAIVDGVEQKRLFVIKPGIYRVLFVLNALFPRFTARQLRQPPPKPSLRAQF
jgi:short-subunit dehydrogenase